MVERDRVSTVKFERYSYQSDSQMVWPIPENSRSRIRKVGKRISKSYNADGFIDLSQNLSEKDYNVVENWRSSHGAVLNTAQAWLRRFAREDNVVIGQRLKRFSTIIDKLTTGRAKDLSTMHDLAGVRVIFQKAEELRSFQERMMASRAKHVLQHNIEKFDYIVSPKNTGYRGVHMVYERQVPGERGGPWNGLKFEVQLRTAEQHAWATAVEVYDSIEFGRFKFERSNNSAYEQFVLISELFARAFGSGGEVGSCPDIDLVKKVTTLEETTGLVQRLKDIAVVQSLGGIKSNSILARMNDGSLVIHEYSTPSEAVRKISDIESQESVDNAVLVGGKTPQHIREAFRNYFDDTTNFVSLYNDAVSQLST